MSSVLWCRLRADTYSKSKYASVISQAGGWDWFQGLLSALHGVAQKHGSDIATVASKWVLDQPQVRVLPNLAASAVSCTHVRLVYLSRALIGSWSHARVRGCAACYRLMHKMRTSCRLSHAFCEACCHLQLCKAGMLACGWHTASEMQNAAIAVAEVTRVPVQVAGVIVGARNASHVADHQRMFTFQLDGDDMQRIEAVSAQGRRPTSDCYTWERGGSWA
jgi:hypothetical protein